MKIKTILTLFFTLSIVNCTLLFAQEPLFSWAKNLGGAGSEAGRSISKDASGNVYTVGYFAGTVDFDPGTGVQNVTSNGGNDIFISKLDSAGNFVWVKQIGGVDDERAFSIFIDASESIYIAGLFDGTADFDPGVGVVNLTSGGHEDVFVLKLSSKGLLSWVKRLGGTAYQFDPRITVDKQGNVYTTGSFYAGTTDFDPGAGTFNFTVGSSWPDMYVSKLDAQGNFVWAKKIGGTGVDGPSAIVTDSSGNIFTTGLFATVVDFDPGAATYNLTSTGSSDVFILKLNASGDLIWVKSMGSSALDAGAAIAVDAAGYVYTSGYFVQTADFDPGAGVYNLTSDGLNDVFISKLDKDGNFVWAKKMGGSNNNWGYAIKTDVVGNVYAGVSFLGKIDVDPGLDSFNLIASDSGRFGLISKLDSAGNFVWAKEVGGGINDLFMDPSGGFFAVGSFDRTRDFDPDSGVFNLTPAGGSDIYVVKLAPCSNSSSLNISTCKEYTSPSSRYTWTSNGIYRDTIPNAAGCDSIITVNLTILQSSVSMISPRVCQYYISPSAKHTWTLSGAYMDTIPNTAGCDSIISINLTIDSVDMSVTKTSSSTLAAAASGAIYQWLDCNDAYAAIQGATGQTFTATANGSYAVIVTKNSCIDTSACLNITTVGLTENEFMGYADLYPNPTSGQITIDLGKVQSYILVKVNNIIGQEVLNQLFEQQDKLQLNVPGEAGLYFIELLDANNQKMCLKVIKQ